MDKKVKYNVDKFYFDNHRVTTIENTDEGFPKGEHGLKLYQKFTYQNQDDKYLSLRFHIFSEELGLMMTEWL